MISATAFATCDFWRDCSQQLVLGSICSEYSLLVAYWLQNLDFLEPWTSRGTWRRLTCHVSRWCLSRVTTCKNWGISKCPPAISSSFCIGRSSAHLHVPCSVSERHRKDLLCFNLLVFRMFSRFGGRLSTGLINATAIKDVTSLLPHQEPPHLEAHVRLT